MLVLEGLLNIYWGLRRPIRLQMYDDNERFRLNRYEILLRTETRTLSCDLTHSLRLYHGGSC